MQSEIPNKFSIYAHRIYYKTKRFEYMSLKQYVYESYYVYKAVLILRKETVLGIL